MPAMPCAAASRRTFATPQGRGLAFTRLGFGGAPLGNLFQAVTDDVAVALVGHAYASGARYFVCTVEAMPRETDAAFVAIDEV